MFVVYFFENKNLLLSQFLKQVPSVGDNLTIKGRKGKISSVIGVDEKKFHVQVDIEIVNKKKLVVDPSKKKRR